MAEYDYDDDGTSLVKDLREQIKALSADNKRLAGDLENFQQEKRAASLSELISAKGLNPKVAKLIPPGLEGDAVTAWLEDYADVFGVPQPEAESAARKVAQEDVEAAGRMKALAEGGISPTKVQDLEQRLRSADSTDDINAILAEAREYIL